MPVGGSLEFEESLYYSDTVKDDHVHYEKPGESPIIPHEAANIHGQISTFSRRFRLIWRNGGNASMSCRMSAASAI